ncbi:hypothetical protein T02_979 [Trichinella nativa]|uniref:Uncharacterized protein n=1 Tax=Trichinella nativa TaxID=6335 RepID=A0A0V1L8I7_9BILA|nr:hypothetical protein T02_979 [Trichinella nativa]
MLSLLLRHPVSRRLHSSAVPQLFELLLHLTLIIIVILFFRKEDFAFYLCPVCVSCIFPTKSRQRAVGWLVSAGRFALIFSARAVCMRTMRLRTSVLFPVCFAVDMSHQCVVTCNFIDMFKGDQISASEPKE